jgi:capsid assembly protease
MRVRQQFRRRGDLAIDPRALSIEFEVPGSLDNETSSGVTVVCIEGPLAQRAGMFDGYDAIVRRFLDALEDEQSSTVLLRINSPGGEVAGLQEAVRTMRRAAKVSGKRVVAYVDEQATSAAYAIATVADQILLPESGCVGSIGVIAELVDISEANRKAGVNVAVITSGAQKADGHPDVPLAQDVLERAQEHVTELAEQFASLVAERRGGSPTDWLALEAGVFHGQDAVAQGLADQVITADQVIEVAQGGAQRGSMAQLGGSGGSRSTRGVKMAGNAKASSERKHMIEEEETSKKTRRYEEEESAEEAEAVAAAEDEDEAKAEAASDDEPEDDEDPPASQDAKALSTDAAILAVARRVTGKHSASEVVGALEAMSHSHRRSVALAARVEKLEREARRAKVDRLVTQAVRQGQLAPAQRAWATDLGMSSLKSLRAYLETAPRLVHDSSAELGPEGEKKVAAHAQKGSASEIWGRFGLDAVGQQKAAELLAQAQAKAPVAGGRN